MSHMFEVMTPENTATVSMNNPITGHGLTVCTGNNMSAISRAIMCFARHQGISPCEVETSIVYASTVASAPRETPTATHRKPVHDGSPDGLPQVGATVHLPTNGPRKPPVPHTIAEYRTGTDGAPIFKAYDYAGWTYIGEIAELLPLG